MSDVPLPSLPATAAPAAAAPAPRAFYESLVRTHGAALFRFAARQSGDRAVAEDLVQETYVEAWRSLGSLRDRGRARAWLFGILRHRYARWVRSLRRVPTPAGLAADVLRDRAHPGPDVVRLLSDRERLQRALDAMDARFREALLLVFAEGLSPQEAAELLGVAKNTVLSRVHRARQFLRGFLRAHDREER